MYVTSIWVYVMNIQVCVMSIWAHVMYEGIASWLARRRRFDRLINA